MWDKMEEKLFLCQKWKRNIFSAKNGRETFSVPNESATRIISRQLVYLDFEILRDEMAVSTCF